MIFGPINRIRVRFLVPDAETSVKALAMPRANQSFDPRERAREKELSRSADVRAVRDGHISPAQMRRDNAFFAVVAQSGQPRLSRSRSLG